MNNYFDIAHDDASEAFDRHRREGLAEKRSKKWKEKIRQRYNRQQELDEGKIKKKQKPEASKSFDQLTERNAVKSDDPSYENVQFTFNRDLIPGVSLARRPKVPVLPADLDAAFYVNAVCKWFHFDPTFIVLYNVMPIQLITQDLGANFPHIGYRNTTDY